MVAMHEPAKQRFLTRLASCLDDGTFVKLTLGHPANDKSALRKLLFRPVIIRGEKQCSVVSRFKTKDETKNHPFSDVAALVETKLGTEFKSANLFTEKDDVQLELGEKDRLRVISTARKAASLDHDRSKARWVDAAAPWMHALEVTDGRGKVRERMGDKFRQIERFVDLLSAAFRESNLVERTEGNLTMCDMGSGKGYLTFAAYDYFRRVENRAATITGVEARDDLVKFCNNVARFLQFEGLGFVKSEIEKYQLPPLDILIALHACDTATDDALFAGIRAGAQIIMAAPCCHKESRPQVDAATGGPLANVLRHGIFAERHAEMASDALRTMLLEREGYRVRVGEFVAAEHTAKNVMLIATKRKSVLTPQAREKIEAGIAQLKNFYGIKHQRLEQLLVV